MLTKSKEKLVKEIVSALSKNDEKQALLIKAKSIFEELEKDFDKEQIEGILDVIKVLNQLFGF
jgi:hypothetical protein